MQLYHGSILLGDITEVYGEFPWMHGSFSPSKDFASYSALFQYLTDENSNWEGPPPFGDDDDPFDDKTWHVKENGEVRGIFVPAILSDGTISWRWC